MTPDPRDDLAFRRERNAANKCAVFTLRAVEAGFSARVEPQKTANSPAKASGRPVGGVSGPGYPTLAATLPGGIHAQPDDARAGVREGKRGACGEAAC